MRMAKHVVQAFVIGCFMILSLEVSRAAEAKPTPAPPQAQAVLDAAAALRGEEKFPEAMAALVAADSSKWAAEDLKRYDAERYSAIRGYRARLQAFEEAKKFEDGLALIAAMTQPGLNPAERSELRKAAEWQRWHWAATVLDAKDYMGAIAKAHEVDVEADAGLSGLVEQVLSKGATMWSTGEFAAARALAVNSATRPECYERLTAVTDKLPSLKVPNAASVVAWAECEWARTYCLDGRYTEALAALRAIPAEGKASVADESKYLTEMCVGEWFKGAAAELEKLGGEDGKAQAAYEKLQDIEATLEACEAPQLAEREKDARMRWVRTTLCRIEDPAQLDSALGFIEANRPETDPYHETMWLTPVVRATTVTQANVGQFLEVWNWTRVNSRSGLLYRRAIERVGEIPTASPLFENTAFAWQAVWALLEGGQATKADGLIKRLYEANALEAGYADVYALWMRGRFQEAIAAADRVLANPDGANTGKTLPVEMQLWTKIFKMRSLIALKRTDEAKTLATEIVTQWPDGHWTAYARKWLAGQEQAK